MKKSFIQSLPIVVSIVGLMSCNVTSHTEKAAGVNFSNYKTFAWANDNNVKKADRVDNDIIDNSIKD